jgi:tetratricopeptide (TPR) repeat protein
MKAQKPPDLAPVGANLIEGLGDYSMPVTAKNADVQRWFDQGLAMTYGFNHDAAERSFVKAAELDPDCAMCWWGAALVLGPHVNAGMDPANNPKAWDRLQRAQRAASGATETEKSFIQALAARYAENPPEDRRPLDEAYAAAMGELAAKYPDDLDVQALYAESMMDLQPWDYWDASGQPKGHTADVVSTLESVMARNPRHAGALHYYVHAVEASPDPSRGVAAADTLRELLPGSGHLVHMPAHIYWRTGRYHDAYRINEVAVHSDEHTVGGKPDQGAQTLYSLLYYPHNIHFLMIAAQMEGRSQEAVAAARRVATDIPLSAYQEVAAMEDFMPLPLFMMVRFGQWDAILKEPQPQAEFQYATGIWHWARGLAYTRQGQLDKATTEVDKLVEIGQTDEMKNFTLYSFAQASTMLDIATHVLAGELAGAQGSMDKMIAELEEAVAIQDNLHYMEPPAWHYPVRHNLGAALLKVGQATEAEAVYREDLRQYHNNGWSLFGLAESLKAQDKTAEAAEVQQQFETAWQYADVQLTSSVEVDPIASMGKEAICVTYDDEICFGLASRSHD